MKKLVPATRSRISRTHADINTENAIRPMTDVMNHAHVQYGSRPNVIPLVRRSRVVAMKFRPPTNCPTQKIRIEIAHSVWPSPCPGPAPLPRALSGAYEVHPESGGPSGTKNAVTSTAKATNVIQND